MLVKDLLDEIEHNIKEYGEDFLNWKVYTEQITPEDKIMKTSDEQADWGKVKDGEGWEYFECVGFFTRFLDRKIFTINVNY